MDTSVLPDDPDFGKTEKLLSAGRVRRHRLDWTDGFFSPSEIRQIVRIAWRYGFDVEFRHSDGATFATFTKESWWVR